MLDPLDSSINNATTVTVRAQDSYGNVDTTYNLDVHLSASGSATVSNSGNVDIVSVQVRYRSTMRFQKQLHFL